MFDAFIIFLGLMSISWSIFQAGMEISRAIRESGRR